MPDIALRKEELTILRSISLTIYGTPRDLYLAWRRFVSSDSLALVDEPDETDIPIYTYNQRTKGRKLQKGKG